MKRLTSSAAYAFAIALTLQVSAVRSDAQAAPKQVTLPGRVGQTKLPADILVKNVSVGPASQASGLPLADLLVSDSYLDNYAGLEGLNFLISNTGQQDAGPFDVSIAFFYPAPSTSSKSTIYRVDGLKVGESKWVSAAPLCCGWAPTEAVVNTTDHYEVVIDPGYSKADPLDPYNPARATEVKPQIAESNKGNNKFAIAKADMRRGKYTATNRMPVAPPMGTTKTTPPIIKH